jgi:hypothetical protein
MPAIPLTDGIGIQEQKPGFPAWRHQQPQVRFEQRRPFHLAQ